MLNPYNTINGKNAYNKLVVNDLLFVECNWMGEETKFGLWSHRDYFTFIICGNGVHEGVIVISHPSNPNHPKPWI